MTTKKCFKCGQEKELDEFYVHSEMADGHLGKCKGCARTDVSTHYRANRTHYAEYEKLRFMSAERKEKTIEYQRKRRINNPEKCVAYSVVSRAVRDGRLEKKPCEVCGSEYSQAHHDDYSQPLKVVWLCRTHHLERHGKQSYQGLTY